MNDDRVYPGWAPQLEVQIEDEVGPDGVDLIHRLHAAGAHRLAASLEARALLARGITVPEIARAQAPVPPASAIRRALRRVGIARSPESPPEIF